MRVLSQRTKITWKHSIYFRSARTLYINSTYTCSDNDQRQSLRSPSSLTVVIIIYHDVRAHIMSLLLYYTNLVDLHVGLPVDDAVKVVGAQAVGLLQSPVLSAASATSTATVWARRQPRGRGHAHRLLLLLLLFAQLVQVGQRAHRCRISLCGSDNDDNHGRGLI